MGAEYVSTYNAILSSSTLTFADVGNESLRFRDLVRVKLATSSRAQTAAYARDDCRIPLA